MTGNNEPLEQCVASLGARKRKLLFACTALVTGAVLSLALGALMLSSVLLAPSVFTGWTRAGLCVLALVLFGGSWIIALGIGAACALFSRSRGVALAKRLDDHYDLKDQTASAVDLAGVDRELAQFAVTRANTLVKEKDASEVFPFRLPRAALFAVVSVVLFAVAVMVFVESIVTEEDAPWETRRGRLPSSLKSSTATRPSVKRTRSQKSRRKSSSA
jgi:hypothetical protein